MCLESTRKPLCCSLVRAIITSYSHFSGICIFSFHMVPHFLGKVVSLIWLINIILIIKLVQEKFTNIKSCYYLHFHYHSLHHLQVHYLQPLCRLHQICKKVLSAIENNMARMTLQLINNPCVFNITAIKNKWIKLWYQHTTGKWTFLLLLIQDDDKKWLHTM